MTATPRHVYRHQALERLFNPRSIAIYGISPNPKSFGARTAALLGDYDGRLLRVNPKYESIGDAPCYASIAALPEVPDCVLIAAPQEAVEQAVLECADRGVGGVVIYASNYAETGIPEQVARQERLTAIARETGLKIIGPNCIGFINFSRRALASFAAADMKLEVPRGPAVALVSQSGGVGFALGQSVQRGMVMSHVITTGNACDVNIADLIAYLADDPACSAIACLFEGMAEPSQLLEAGEIAWAADKPVIVSKLAFGEQGAAAALSHTGLLAGSATAYKAAFDRNGIIMLESLAGLLETASFFAKAPRRPSAHGVAVIGASGGSMVAATDMAERYGVPLPQPRPALHAFLSSQVPSFASVRNPCDVTAAVAGDPDRFLACIEAMLSDEAYGTVVLPQAGLSARTAERRRRFSELAQRLGKPVCLPFIGGWVGGPGSTEAEQDQGFGWFYSLDRCFATLAAWHARDDRRRQWEKDGPRKLIRVSPADAASRSAQMMAASGHGTLTEREAKAVLAAYGVPVVGEQLVQSADAAVSAAQELGFPVVLKVESPDLPHKTEAGVIRLSLKNEDEVKAAYAVVMGNAGRVSPKPRINGVLVQPMLSAGTEIMIGAKIDPLFGPLIVVGLGGIMVELLKDTVVELAPINHGEARAMLDRLKGRAALAGFRGSEPVDLDKLSDIIVRLSEFAADQKARITELDVNPLICAGGRITAVDALIVKK